MTEEITQADWDCAAILAEHSIVCAFAGNDLAALRMRIAGDELIEAFVRQVAKVRTQARQAALEEGMHKATYELVDAEGTGEETDAAYNRGVMAAIAAIRTLSTPEPTKGE